MTTLPRITSWQGDNPGSCHPFFCGPKPQRPVIFPDHPEETVEVAVIGAGLSGLTAAYHLRERQVAVLEAGDRPGGVCLAGNFHGIPFPAGSAYFYYPWDDAWKSWYASLGLDLDGAIIAPPTSALWHRGGWLADCFSPKALPDWPVSDRDRLGLQKLVADLARWEEDWDVLGTRQLPEPQLDDCSLAQYVEQERGLSPEVTEILAPYCRSCLGGGPETISAWAGLYFLMAEWSSGSRLAAFPEGNARLTTALAQVLPRPVRLQQVVTALRRTGDGVEVLLWDRGAKEWRSLKAGVVILAAGKVAARRLLGGDWGWREADWERFRYSSYVVAALRGPLSLRAPGYENWVVGEPAFSDFILTPRNAAAGEDKVLVLYAPQAVPQGQATLLGQTPEAQAETLLAALERHFPGTKQEIKEIQLFRFGHAQIMATPGFNTWLRRECRTADGPLILAHSDLEGLPCVEAAIVQGQRAAREALAWLQAAKS
ncbi:MAG: FAD-dependent oxidoreductase [Deltaproteobacteria bacterium]|nr:FAD-dependent oxidoreductase [Deltaproteobacteria bacterium]